MVFVTDPDDLDRFQVAINPETERISIRGLGAPDVDFGVIETFLTSQGFASEQITLTSHSLQDGEAVFYSRNGGSEDIGLTDNTRYWVAVVDANTVTMHTSRADAIADASAVDLTTSGAETHELRTGKATTGAVTFASGDTYGAFSKVTFDAQDLSTVAANDDITIVSGGDIGHYTIASADDTNDFVILNETLTGADNIVTDGDFPDGTNWILQPSWAVGGADLDATAPTIGDVAAQDVANEVLADSTVYECTFEVTAYTSGNVHLDIGGNSATTSTGTYVSGGGGAVGTDRGATGVFTERLTTPGTTGQQIAVVSGTTTAFTGSVDNLIITPLVTARIGDGTTGSELVGSEGGTVADGVSMQALYSFLKEEWRTLSDTDMPDLIKFTFPIESITREQFEIGGPTHSNWDFEDATTRNLLRTGGWTSLNTNNEILDIYPGIVTLGSLDSDTQVYYIQEDTFTTTPTDFVLTGTVNQAINALTVSGGFDANKIPTGQVDGSSDTIDFSGGGTDTIDVAGVDFGALGYLAGDKVQILNAENSGNNGIFTITAVTTTQLDVSGAGLTENATDVQALLSPVTDNRDFLKLFARKKARTYVDAELADIGVTTIESIVNRFPLSHVSDPAITLDDGQLQGDPAETIFSTVTQVASSETDGELDDNGDGTFTFTSDLSTFVTDNIQVGDTLSVETAETTGGSADDVGFYEILSVDTETTLTVFNEPTVGAVTAGTSDDAVFSTYTRYRSQGDTDGSIADVGGDNVARLTDTGQTFSADGVTSGDLLVLTDGWAITGTYLFGTSTASGDANVLELTSVNFRTTHGFIVGDRITISAADETANDGTFIVIEIFDGGSTDNQMRVENTDGTAVTFTADPSDTNASLQQDNWEGVYKVIESADDGDASDVGTTTMDFQVLDPDDHVGTASPTEVDYHVLQVGMGLNYREKIATPRGPAAETLHGTGTTDIDFSGATIIRDVGMGEQDWTRDNYVVGGNVTISGATTAGNDGTYIITAIDTASVTNDRITVINTDGTTPSFTGDTADTPDLSGTSGHVRTLNGVNYSFNWRMFGNGGTLAQCFEWIQRQLRRGRASETLAETDIDRSELQFRGDITDLLMAFSTPTGTTINMYIDDLASSDLNNITQRDINGVSRNFAFIAGITINLNDNISTASTNKVVVFFTDPDGNNTVSTPVVGNEFNTVGALVVDDATSGGSTMQAEDTALSSLTFQYDFDNNVQGGREPTQATEVANGTAVTIVSIATDTAQYVQTTGNIQRQSTNIFSLVAALERNYSNP